ncbi:MAG: sodium/solute symporter [Opitutaceae bacterium]|nr:sodium/solute symporter [Cephaloticoccus sp.]MCP5530201.1 sodium/solute symporter [Opitutaceae bacterium]
MNPLDLAVIILYLVVVAGIGLYAARGNKTTESYFTASRSIPAWAVGFTLMATIIGSGTFVGHPGTAFQKGLILLIPHLLLPVVLYMVAKIFVPFYRRVVRMSAYEYIGERFGLGGRLYTSFGFLADRIFDLGVTLLTTALAVSVLTGWGLQGVILGVGLFTLAYTMIGGIKAVVWTDVVQGIILMSGGAIIILRLLFAPEAGAPFAVVGEAWRMGRLGFGSWEVSWRMLFDPAVTTQWLFIATYAVQWSRRYITDQHMVQRYLIAKSDEAASRGAMVGAWMCVPIFATFMITGACLAGFFSLTGLPGPATGDQVMPFFMAHYLPAGIVGLLVAAILAAAMSTVSGDLNSVATVATTDHFATYFPNTTDRTRLFFGRLAVLAGGLLAAWVAVVLIPQEGQKPIMERAITIAAILSGGTLGLFMLGFLTRTATRRGCYIGIACCLAFTGWAILTEPTARHVDAGFNFEMNPILIGVLSHLVLFSTGWLASRIFGGYRPANVDQLTFWSRRAQQVIGLGQDK